MSEEIKEIPLKERIEKILESGWVNEFNYLENQLQEARYLVVILQQKVEQLEKENKELNRMCELYGQSLYNADLTKAEKKVEQLENIRKEAIKYVQEKADYPISYYHCLNDLLNILNKGDNNGK